MSRTACGLGATRKIGRRTLTLQNLYRYVKNSPVNYHAHQTFMWMFHKNFDESFTDPTWEPGGPPA